MATKLLWKMAMIILGAGLFSRCTGGFSNIARIPWSRQRPLSSKTALQSAASGKAADVILPSHVRKWLDIELPEGRCVGVSMSAGADASWLSENHARNWQWMERAYHPDEIDYGKSLSGSRAESFWLGRLAMRLALDFPEYPILKDSFGRPALDGKVLGSISHKGDCGIALVSHSTSRFAGIGIDLEYTSRPGKKSIAPRVLTDREQRSLGGILGVSVEEEVLLRFSLKEAIYKAVHPLLCQYVGFQEAEVTPNMDGTASCTWFLESGNDAVLHSVSAHWRRLEDENFFLTSARVEKVL